MLALVVYALVLQIIAIRAVFGFGWGKAIVAAWVVPLALVACLAIVAISMLVLLGPAVGNVFSNIVEQLSLTPSP